MRVSRSAVQQAKKVIAEGSAELVRAVEDGKIAVSAAASLTSLPESEQSEIALVRPRFRTALAFGWAS